MRNMQNCIFQKGSHHCGETPSSIYNLFIFYRFVDCYIYMKVSPYFCIFCI